ncbi:MAG: TIGR04222 domain-containing membrane protein [Nitrospirae bacterium]|nr:TIGR04222 domain-containing membrane protein [Nitrospirota bacterium]
MIKVVFALAFYSIMLFFNADVSASLYNSEYEDKFEPASLFCLIILIYIAGYAIVRIKKAKASVLVDNGEPTPAEIAYLNKGRRHAICVSLFDLIRRGVLEIKSGNALKSTKKDDRLLSYEIMLVGFFRNEKKLSNLLKNKDALKNYDLGIINSLLRKGCLKDAEEERSVGNGLIRNSLFSLLLLLAFMFNSDVLFIKGNPFFYAAVGVSIIALISGAVLRKAHIHSKRGNEFLNKYTDKIKTSADYVSDKNSYDPSLSYGVAVLGFGILAGSVFDEFLNYVSYTRSRFPDSSSGCSSCSTTGGDGGSSGDGGGSGGCGGCGGGD